MNIRHWYLSIRHYLFHGEDSHMLEHGVGELFLRCHECGLRSPGIQLGPQRLSSALPGYPERARLVVSAVARVVPPAVLDTVVEVEPDALLWARSDMPRRSERVH